jgi:thymidylate synthase (FAD)
MRILKDAGGFVVLTPVAELRDQLLRIERAGRTCYQSERKPITEETAAVFINMILRSGHESVIEHSYMTVQFNDLSRGFTHEQVRHRLTAISQESTRYVDYAKEGEGPDLEKFQLNCVVPPHRNENEKVLLEDGREMSITEMFAEHEKFYRALRKAGWVAQDARQVLPIGIKSQIVISANFREWRHIFKMRASRRAHWEIRRVMCDLLECIKPILSPIFDDFVEAGCDKNGLRYFEKKDV